LQDEEDRLKQSRMKRINNLYNRIISLDNLEAADVIARKGKKGKHGIQMHDRDREINLWRLHCALAGKTYKTSAYTTFTVFEPKERLVYRLPYYPDRITHHAIMNILEPVFVSMFIAQSYSCIKGRGIHGAARAVKKALADAPGTRYCLKLDITKFYPSVDHAVLKTLLRQKFKDPDLLWLLEEIIDSAPGLPIGNYLSQYLANFYLTGFDHWLKEVKGVRHYFRYADDLVILAQTKEELHSLLADIRAYLGGQLRLQVKGNYQIFPVEARGIDFVGYVFYHTHTRMRKSIKQNFARMVHRRPSMPSIASYWGWAKHCNSNHLVKKLLQK
jgi:RNA-directed DNA polymerase